MELAQNNLNKISVEFNTEELSPAQVRLVKSLNAMIASVSSTRDEAEFFESSAEAMRLCASIIKESRFSKENRGDIPYADQAIEFSIDGLQELIDEDDVIQYDN